MRFAVTIGLSAFLVFQVQPIVARAILPWFGGSAAVWGVCLVFFQSMLLAGYGYAHLLRRALSSRAQVGCHLGLLALSLALLPITPDPSLRPAGADDPALGILWLLAWTVAVPYTLIAASGPLIQHWFHVANPSREPYRLYALSNAGSLLGLLSYPFVFEPRLTLGQQSGFWSVGYGLYALCCLWCGWELWRRASQADAPSDAPSTPDDDEPEAEVANGEAQGWTRWAIWAGLGATGSAMLVATTHQISQDIAVTPLMWVVPLSLYLLTFIIAFERDRWYDRRVWGAIFVLSVAGALTLQSREEDINVIVQMAGYCALLLSGGVICHGELARRRPPASELTGFYLMMSFGGALGGSFASLAAPLIFVGTWELYLTILVALGVLIASGAQAIHRDRGPNARTLWLVVSSTLAIGVVVWMVTLINHFHEAAMDSRRNFYGVLRVYEYNSGTEDAYRTLVHGRIVHGAQYLAPPRRQDPIRYYAPSTGVGLALEHHPERAARGLRVGVVGLGVGTLAAYGRPEDHFTIYEIDPAVVDAARQHFTYLDDTQAKTDVELGDARVTLERQLAQPRAFDVLAIDAFSGDAIPVHLLTQEAIALYMKHLAPGGVLALHITNRHVDLWPVVWTIAQAQSLSVATIHTSRDSVKAISSTTWVLLAQEPTSLVPQAIQSRDQTHRHLPAQPTLWTDDHSDLLSILR